MKQNGTQGSLWAGVRWRCGWKRGCLPSRRGRERSRLQDQSCLKKGGKWSPVKQEARLGMRMGTEERKRFGEAPRERDENPAIEDGG